MPWWPWLEQKSLCAEGGTWRPAFALMESRGQCIKEIGIQLPEQYLWGSYISGETDRQTPPWDVSADKGGIEFSLGPGSVAEGAALALNPQPGSEPFG